MSHYNKILALLGLAALPLLLACDDGPTAPGLNETPGEQEHAEQANALRVIPAWNSIAVGEWLRLRVILPGRGDEGADRVEQLEWGTSNPAVAIVNDGTVRGLKPGNVLISAEFQGYRGSAHVTVRAGEIHEPKEHDEIK